MSYALVTGAAKGIGKAIAAELALRGYNLLLVDIDKPGLTQTAQVLREISRRTIYTLSLDLTRPDAIDTLWQWTASFHDDLQVIVNNAGYGLNSAFADTAIEQHLNLVDLNIKAQLKISHAFLPVLQQFPKAWLLNVGSTTCYQSVPYLASYAASKAFVISFTRSLRYELRHTGVSVSCLSPGSTDTDFVNRAGMSDRIKKTADRFNMTPQQVAAIAVKGLFKGKAEIIPGFTNKLNAWLPKFFPKSFVEKIAARIYQPRKEDAYEGISPVAEAGLNSPATIYNDFVAELKG